MEVPPLRVRRGLVLDYGNIMRLITILTISLVTLIGCDFKPATAPDLPDATVVEKDATTAPAEDALLKEDAADTTTDATDGDD